MHFHSLKRCRLSQKILLTGFPYNKNGRPTPIPTVYHGYTHTIEHVWFTHFFLFIFLLQWILDTNVVLMKTGIVHCSKCTFCEDSIDIFWQCSCRKRFSQILENKANRKCNITFQARITQNFLLYGLDSDNSIKTDKACAFIICFAEHQSIQKQQVLTTCGCILKMVSAKIQS